MNLPKLGRTLPVLGTCVLALGSMGCGSVAGPFLIAPRVVKPNQNVVAALVCRGDEAGAQEYLRERGASRAEIVERVEEARRECKK